MKFSLVITSLFIGAVSFTGCGSNSSSNSKTASDNIDSNGVEAVATKVVCDPEPFTSEYGDTYDMKYSTNGDITVECKTTTERGYLEFKLKSGVDSLTITQLQKVESYSGTINGKKGSGKYTYNYKAGTVHIQENSPEGNYDCIETFVSPLPSTIIDTFSISNLLEWDGYITGTDDDRISTTCPSSYYDYLDEEDEKLNSTIKGVTNYTLTDSNGKKHYITETDLYTLRNK